MWTNWVWFCVSYWWHEESLPAKIELRLQRSTTLQVDMSKPLNWRMCDLKRQFYAISSVNEILIDNKFTIESKYRLGDI